MRLLKLFFIIIISIASIALCLANRHMVTIHLFLANLDVQLPLFLFFIFSLILGMIIGRSIGFVQMVKSKLKRG